MVRQLAHLFRTSKLSAALLLLPLCLNASPQTTQSSAITQVRTSKTTMHRAQLNSLDQNPQQDFGDAVAVGDNTVVVGALGVAGGNGEGGAAYVYVKPQGGWMNTTQTATLTPSDVAYFFGASVAMSGDTIIVGAPWTEVNGIPQQGAVYVFVKPAGGWKDMTETAKLIGAHVDNKGEDRVGSTVAIDGDTIVAGVPNVLPNDNGLGFGEALVYVKPAHGWVNATEDAVLYINPAFYPSQGAGFGFSVGISGNAIVVGAIGCCFEGRSTAGQAYVWVKPKQGWITTDGYTAKLKGTDVRNSDNFGWSVAIDGATIVVGSPQQDDREVGAAYVYVEPKTGWHDMTQTAELTPLTFPEQGDFGQSVAISKNTIIGGAPFATVSHLGQGATFSFRKPVSGWKSTSQYTAKRTNKAKYYDFGQSVSINPSSVAVGFSGTYYVNGGADVFPIQ